MDTYTTVLPSYNLIVCTFHIQSCVLAACDTTLKYTNPNNELNYHCLTSPQCTIKPIAQVIQFLFIFSHVYLQQDNNTIPSAHASYINLKLMNVYTLIYNYSDTVSIE